ncbi:CopG family transcriptional regulator [Candidatus Shapirobacteria bacterium CG08_land_8_20_14_0_20_39_18]|uniref:CopG family transcriptional regulator n=1 Tax=Candidatus Shapirobacteria bacterium CG08_land_8_20_14_0_20_39_18 TaxID=1974883 RepID=A0A2M6XCP5_9BACT|nr:MAG: CopG family transcriptional regulator [Candidatus Shapirobacteria bacterium CG08_land_8_20_14_0_20_39_18]PIY65075.1 MAG: CopG family transcriptional regulator [Candidatus Shapirobacteria bacterium CG_4_10_14_0_8_um_filter_39_15]
MIRTQIYLPEEFHQDLVMMAQKANVSMAELIRKFVAEGITSQEKKGTSGSLLLEIAHGAVKGLPENISTEHDKYLYSKK